MTAAGVPPTKPDPPGGTFADRFTLPTKFSARLLFASRACTVTLIVSPARTVATASTARCVAVTLKELLRPLMTPALEAVTA